VQGRAPTIVLRGAAKRFLEEAERSIHDAIMIVRRAKKAGREALARALKLDGKSQLIIQGYTIREQCWI
jgi:T-complex protein 1 subunit eta